MSVAKLLQKQLSLLVLIGACFVICLAILGSTGGLLFLRYFRGVVFKCQRSPGVKCVDSVECLYLVFDSSLVLYLFFH